MKHDNPATLIVSDRPLQLRLPDAAGAAMIDLSALRIAGCMGCFGCWTRTPGRCVIRDDAVKVYPMIARSERLLYVSRIRYGGYDAPMKTLLERAIPVQQAFIRLVEGETHHVQREVAEKAAVILAYGDTGEEERALFRRLAARNARNMNFSTCKVLFCREEDVEAQVRKELNAWQIL